MIPAIAGASENQGTRGVQVAAAAEQLEAVFFNMVVSAMEKTGLQGASLATGADVYNGIASRAAAQQLFGSISGSLTKAITNQLSGSQNGARNVLAAASGPMSLAAVKRAPPMLSFANIAGGSGCPTVLPSQAPTITQATAFARAIWPCLEQGAAQLGVSPVALLSQAALETGWGTSAPGNNFFGIKAAAGQAATQQATLEYSGGTMQRTTANFAAYASPTDAVAHYTSLIRNLYPAAVGAASISGYAQALAQGGYATDPSYADKIVSISRSPLMADVLRGIGVAEAQP